MTWRSSKSVGETKKAMTNQEVVPTKFHYWLHKVCGYGYVTSGLAMILSMTVIVLDVFLRNAFNMPIWGTFEMIRIALLVMVAPALAYAALHKRHVRVDILISRFPQRFQAIVEIIVTLITIGLLAIVVWQNVLYIPSTLGFGHITDVLGLPLAPFLAVIVVSFTLYIVVLVTQLVESLSKVVRK